MIFIEMLNTIFDLFFSPFSKSHPLYGITWVSLLTALIVIPLFKYTSNQEGIKEIKDRIIGHILEIRLFRDDVRVIFSAQKNILKYNMIYIGHMLKPLVFMIVPVMIIIIQTEARFGYRPLKVGESAIVEVKEASAHHSDVELLAPKGIKIETTPLRIKDSDGEEIYWRIRAVKEGEFAIRFKSDDSETAESIIVGSDIRRFPQALVKGGIVRFLLHPADKPLPEDSSIKEIRIHYPPLYIRVFGWKFHWLVPYLILTLILSFILVKPFKVNI